MNLCVNSPPLSSSHATNPFLNFPKWHHHHHQKPRNYHLKIPTISYSLRRQRRHHRRRHNPPKTTNTEPSSPLSDQKLQMVIDVEHLLPNNASVSMERFLRSSELKFNEFVHSGGEAFEDLQSLISIDSDRRVTISCRRSTVQFMGNLALRGLLIVFAFTVFVKLVLGFRNTFRLRYGGGGVIRRRDRSLGGREVVVAKRDKMMNEVRVLTNPLSPTAEPVVGVSKAMPKNWVRRKDNKLPKWWPASLPPPVLTVNKEEYQRVANRLIRAIMDYRMSGKDILKDDIIQLRQICRTYGVRVFIETANARDSLYRASVDFVLNICGSMASQSAAIQIDGEDAREFLAGLADNIRLENIHAARMVSAAVAARTRSWILQAWALEMQGKHSEAMVELSKLCLTHRIFPPEEYSPEMEMVARGLEKHLQVEQRAYLMNMLIQVCGEESRRSVAEALGLILSQEVAGDQQETKYT